MIRKTLFGFFCSVAICSAADEGVTKVGQLSTFVPLNASVYRLHVPETGDLPFLLAEGEEHGLVGQPPWVGEIDGRRVLVRTAEDYGGIPIGFQFVDGILRFSLKGDKEQTIDVPAKVSPDDAFDKLWIASSVQRRFARPPDIWQGGTRLRLWFENPNDAGILLAESALLFFVLAVICWKRSCMISIVAALISMAALFFLLQTGSRGGLVAFVSGAFVASVVRAYRRIRWRIVFAGVLAVAILAVIAVRMIPAGRFTTDLFKTKGDESNKTRVEMLVKAPGMFVSAAGGWGLGESGRAYVDWFQDRTDRLCKNLISGHLTLLVELGWWRGWLYVAAWFMILGWLLLAALERGNPCALALWVSLAVSGLFNPTLFRWEGFVLPVVMGLLPDVWKTCIGKRKLLWASCGCLVLAALFCLGFALMARKSVDRDRLALRGGVVTFNGCAPETIIVDDDYAMNGGYWWFEGKEIRQWFGTHPEVRCGYARSLDDVGRDVRRLVLIGRQVETLMSKRHVLAERYPALKEIVLLSPSVPPGAFPVDMLSKYRVHAFMGEIAVRRLGGTVPAWVSVIRGAELYLPSWLRLATRE